MTRVLIFFPHNPLPPRSGAHQRCLQMIGGFDSLGAEVTLASSTHTSESGWQTIPTQELRSAGISRLEIHSASIWDGRYIKYMHKFYHSLRREPPLDSANYAPPGLCRWFVRLAREIRPDIILINYAFWGRLVSRALHTHSTTVMDSLDLVSLYRPRFILMDQYMSLPPISPAKVDPKLLQEEFFDSFEFKVAPQEFEIYDRYKFTIAITRADADLIQKNTTHTRVVNLPMTQTVYALMNTYEGDALYTAGRNPFNTQGYLYFAARVLPRVLEQVPAFCLTVTGAMCEDVAAVHGVELRGFVSDLTPYYLRAPFLVCPILAKTGQQIKIIEAMAHGVPVIATRAAAEGSPIRHAENGLVARDASEFADFVIQLWRDRSLCRSLGNAARETIATEFSQTRLLNGLTAILNQN